MVGGRVRCWDKLAIEYFCYLLTQNNDLNCLECSKSKQKNALQIQSRSGHNTEGSGRLGDYGATWWGGGGAGGAGEVVWLAHSSGLSKHGHPRMRGSGPNTADHLHCVHISSPVAASDGGLAEQRETANVKAPLTLTGAEPALQRRQPCISGASPASPAKSSSNLKKLLERVPGFHSSCYFPLSLVFRSFMPAQLRKPTVPEWGHCKGLPGPTGQRQNSNE